MMITQPIRGSGNIATQPGGSNVPRKASQTASSSQSAEPDMRARDDQAVQVSIETVRPPERKSEEPTSQEQVVKRVTEMVDRIRQRITTVNFQIEQDSHQVIVRVVNKETGETVRQLPPEEVLRLRESLSDFKGALISEIT